MKKEGVLVWAVGFGLSVGFGAGPAFAVDEVDAAADKAEIQVLKARLEKLERKVEQQELQAVSSTGEKPVSAGVGLPSGLQGLGMSGFVDTSFVYNFQHPDPSGRTNRGRIFDVNPSGFTIHAAELVLEKPMSDESPVGFRTDLFFGDDAELIHSTGLGNDAGPESPEAFDLQQAYVTARAPVGDGIDFKIGKFVTLLGAEVIESLANWNFSRSYLFGFAIPFTHTGALASYPLGEIGSVTAGLVNGWDIVDDNNTFKDMIANVTLTPMEGLTFAVNGITGAPRAADNRNDRSVIDLVATWTPIEALTLMANYDYGHESSIARVTGTAGGGAGFDTANWAGLALYAKYDLTEKWALSGRWEWFDDKNGVRTAFATLDGTSPNSIDFYGYTLTSQWKLHDHMLARLEYRHDQADEKVFFHGGSGFINAADTIATEFIVHF